MFTIHQPTKEIIMFDALKSFSAAAAAAEVAAKVTVIATGVALGTLAAAKITEMMKSDN